ncbi:nicotinamide N-methyltransferase-like [Ptychodera flava]|uniref:nicotinamide N-methyltransferase-like n=1 Tax=Ptychodera flava TaxID=63121 RepID=UPI003969DC17
MATIYRDSAYNTVFECMAYLNTHYFSDVEIVPRTNKFHFDMFQQTLSKGNFTGPRLLDIGGGPNLGNAIYTCTQFPEIVFSDYSEKCRQAVEKWVENTPDAINWSQFIKNVCDMEGTGNTWEERQAMVRRSIKDIIHCDVLKSNPLEPKVFEPFDAIVTSYCLESACPDRESFKVSMKNIINLLKPGGILMMFAALNESFYLIGEKRFYNLELDETFVKEAVVESGCHIVSSEVFNFQTTTLLFVAAIKN